MALTMRGSTAVIDDAEMAYVTSRDDQARRAGVGRTGITTVAPNYMFYRANGTTPSTVL